MQVVVAQERVVEHLVVILEVAKAVLHEIAGHDQNRRHLLLSQAQALLAHRSAVVLRETLPCRARNRVRPLLCTVQEAESVGMHRWMQFLKRKP
jgi:hypothetical protein